MNPCTAWAAALALATTVAAQTCALHVQLAADPDGAGPPAWTWVRDRILPRLGGPAGTRDALDLRIDDTGAVAIRAGEAPAEPSYAVFTLVAATGTEFARGTCGLDGTEVWQVDADAPPPPIVVQRLVARFGYELRTGWLELDVAAAVGNLMAGSVPGDVVSDLLTLGALECGAVGALARVEEPGGVRLEGRSAGGLALPAVLIALATAQGDATEAALPVADDGIERWLLLVATAHSEEQEEAARQLARFDDPRARRALERLLHADGRARLVAMHALGRLRALDSIGAVLRAVDPAVPGSAEVAARVVASMLPPPVRTALAVPRDATARPAPALETSPRVPDRRWIVTLAGGLIGGLAVGTILGGRVRRRSGGAAYGDATVSAHIR